MTDTSDSFLGEGTIIYLEEFSTSYNQDLGCEILAPASCAGKYCFSAIRGEGTPYECEIQFCRDIMYCEIRTPRKYTWCLTSDDIIHAREGENKKDFIYASGHSYLTEPDKEIGSDYTFYSKISIPKFDAISEKIGEQIDAVFMEIQKKGYSVYEIKNQKELTTADDYIFKFNKNGEIIWVAYSGERKREGKRAERKNDFTQQNKNVVLVYPNPFNEEINIEIYTENKQNIYVSLVGLMGKTIKRERYTAASGENLFSMNVANLISDGVYAILITGENGFNYSQKIIHHKK